MTRIAWLDDLARHSEWADARTWTAVLAAPAARTDERILAWLHHVHLVQHGFLHAWTEARFRPAGRGDFAEPEALAAWGRQAHAALRGFVAGASEDDLERPIRVPWAGRVEQALGRPIADPSLGHTAMQVAMHTTHHRGQVAARLRDLGVEPPTTDLIAWLWVERPDPEWPAAVAAP